MKNILKNILTLTILISILLLSGCSGSSNESDSDVNYDEQNYASNDDIQDYQQIQEKAKESTGDSNNMKHCYTYDKSQPALYDYYYTSNEYYEKAEVTGSGAMIKVVTSSQFCTKSTGSPGTPEDWNCITGSDSKLREHISNAKELTSPTMASVMKIKCEDIAYDASKFVTE